MDPRASAILNAYDNGGQLAPLSDTAGLDIDEAYGISGEIHAARLARGEVVRGRKIGFTNRSIWEKYGVDAPMWSYIYDTTYNELGDDGVIALPPQAEPRLEPEIALCFKATPTADMSVAEIATDTGASRNTIKAHLKALTAAQHLERHGAGRGTWYALA